MCRPPQIRAEKQLGLLRPFECMGQPLMGGWIWVGDWRGTGPICACGALVSDCAELLASGYTQAGTPPTHHGFNLSPTTSLKRGIKPDNVRSPEICTPRWYKSGRFNGLARYLEQKKSPAAGSPLARVFAVLRTQNPHASARGARRRDSSSTRYWRTLGLGLRIGTVTSCVQCGHFLRWLADSRLTRNTSASAWRISMSGALRAINA
jgi:hypothetical protein